MSKWGDLTHGGGTRFVLDLREAPDGSRALIAAPETPGTPENPTWYYDGTGGDDDATDHVLLTDASYLLGRARWSRNGNRIAFDGTSQATSQSGVFVADVVRNTCGEPIALANILLVATGGASPSWGGNNRVAFARAGSGFVVDVSVPTSPVEFSLGPVTSPPALSSDGVFVVYSKSVGDRWDLYLRQVTESTETQITDAERVPETKPGFPEWSPDDTQILLSVDDPCGNGCRSLAIIDLEGTARRTMITKTFVVQDGKGRTGRSVIVGAQGSAIWRN